MGLHPHPVAAHANSFLLRVLALTVAPSCMHPGARHRRAPAHGRRPLLADADGRSSGTQFLAEILFVGGFQCVSTLWYIAGKREP